MAESQATEEMLKLARYQILDRRNATEAAKDRLLLTMADEIERLAAINRLRFSDEQTKEIERLTRALESSGLKRLQADIERDCSVEKVAELRKLLSDCADPVSSQLVEARRNLKLYKGYSSRERGYQIEIEELERLMKAISPPVDVPAPRGKPCTCPDTSATACGVERGHKLGELWYCQRAALTRGPAT